MQIPPQRIHSVPLGEGSVVVVIELDMAFVERCLVSPAHHISAELLVIKDHCTNKGSHLLLGRPLPVEVPEHFFLSLGGGRAEGQPSAAGSHQHESGNPLRTQLSHPNRRGPSQTVA
ncbi:Uncharacterised protein [Mycobacteroides abscessus subsp. abscessus]|nr:Uncharacterised protein [Mycobacteroides abscessus subsp. abscessus]